MAEPTTSTIEKADSTETDITIDAVNLLAQGKRNMVCGEIPQAVNQLEEACRLLAIKFGETANECGEAYFLYGKALLDMARLESGVLGNALQGVPDEEEDETEDKDAAGASTSEDKEKDESAEEDMDKIREQVFDAMGERDEEKAAREKTEKENKKQEGSEDTEKVDEKMEENSEKKEEGSDEKQDISEKGVVEEKEKKDEDEKQDISEKGDVEEKEKKDDEKKDDEVDEKMDAEGDDEEGNEDEEGEEGDEEDAEADGEAEGSANKEEDDAEDVPNLQLAWEMLELAKMIYLRQDGKEMKLKTAEAHLKLGEVGLETEQYEQAIGDFNECLKLQKEHLDPEDRLLAETYYQLGLAFSFNAQFDEAIESYRCATKVIESKLEKLNKFVEDNESGKGKETASFDDPLFNAQKEIKDLKEILPDIMAKIEDAEEEKKNRDQVKQMVKANVASDMGTTTVGFGEPSSSGKGTTTVGFGEPSSSGKGTTTVGFGEPSSSDKGTTTVGFGEPSSSSDKVESTSSTVSNITHLVRKKRKPEEEEESAESKKPRQDAEQEAGGDADSKKISEDKVESTTDDAGDAKTKNGTMNGNGAVNGNGDNKAAEEPPKEIVSKTVEDVVKKKEEEQMETSEAAAVETS